MHSVSVMSHTLFSDYEIVKQIGLESFAYHQSILLIEESILMIDLGEVEMEGKGKKQIREENESLQ